MRLSPRRFFLQIPLLFVSMNYILVDIWYYYSSCKGAIMLYWISILDLHAKIIPINQQSLYTGLMQMIHTVSPVFVFKEVFSVAHAALLHDWKQLRAVDCSTSWQTNEIPACGFTAALSSVENEQMHWFASLIITSQIWAGEQAPYERVEHSSSWKTAHRAESKNNNNTPLLRVIVYKQNVTD